MIHLDRLGLQAPARWIMLSWPSLGVVFFSYLWALAFKARGARPTSIKRKRMTPTASVTKVFQIHDFTLLFLDARSYKDTKGHGRALPRDKRNRESLTDLGTLGRSNLWSLKDSLLFS